MTTHDSSTPLFARSASLLVLGILLLNLAARHACSVDEDPDVLSVAQRGWAEYEKLFSQLQGTFTIESRLVVNGRETFERGTICYLQSGAWRLAELLSRTTDPHSPVMPLQLHCVNDRYGFRLSRDSDNDSWQTQAIYQTPEGPPSDKPLWLFRGTTRNISPVTLCGRRLLDLVQEAGFRVDRVTRLDGDRYCLDFTITSDNSTGIVNPQGEVIQTRLSIQSGQLVVARQRRWALESATMIQRVDQDTLATEIDFSFGPNARYIPTHVKITYRSDNKRVASGTVNYEVDFRIPEKSLTREQFTLSHYGFAEPDIVDPKQ